MRKKLYEIIEQGEEVSRISSIYDAFMMIAIIISIIPLCFHSETWHTRKNENNMFN